MTQFFLKMTLNDFDLMTRLYSPSIHARFLPVFKQLYPKLPIENQQKLLSISFLRYFSERKLG